MRPARLAIPPARFRRFSRYPLLPRSRLPAWLLLLPLILLAGPGGCTPRTTNRNTSSGGGGSGGGGGGGGGNQPPDRPTNLAPPDGMTNVLSPVVLVASPFSDPNGDSHFASFWNVATDPGFDGTTIVWKSGQDPVNLESVAVPVPLPPPGPYWWRVKYKDSQTKESTWSAPTSFSLDQIPDTPVNLAPADGGIVSSPTTLQASPYSEPSGEAQFAAQWQVTDTQDDWSAPVFDSGEDTTNLSTITLASLPGGRFLWWRVRYRDLTGSWSAWSQDTSFIVLSCTTTQFAFSVPGPGGCNPFEVWLVGTDGTNLQQIAADASCTGTRHDLLWASSGSYLVYPTALGVRIVNDQGFPITTLAKNQGEYSWSADGFTLLFSSQGDGIWSFTIGSGAPVLLVSSPLGDFDHNPVFSPDQTQIAYVRHDANGIDFKIILATASVGTGPVVHQGQSSSKTPADLFENLQLQWFPDGKNLLFKITDGPGTTSGIWTIDVSKPSNPKVAQVIQGNVKRVRLLPGGLSAAYLTGTADVFLADTQTWTPTAVATQSQLNSGVQALAASPGGGCLAILTSGTIFAYDLATGALIPTVKLSQKGSQGGLDWQP